MPPFVENLKIEWPEDDDDEEPPPKEAQSLVEKLLVQDPDMRLGSQALGGTHVLSVQFVVVFMQPVWASKSQTSVMVTARVAQQHVM